MASWWYFIRLWLLGQESGYSIFYIFIYTYTNWLVVNSKYQQKLSKIAKLWAALLLSLVCTAGKSLENTRIPYTVFPFLIKAFVWIDIRTNKEFLNSWRWKRSRVLDPLTKSWECEAITSQDLGISGINARVATAQHLRWRNVAALQRFAWTPRAPWSCRPTYRC